MKKGNKHNTRKSPKSTNSHKSVVHNVGTMTKEEKMKDDRSTLEKWLAVVSIIVTVIGIVVSCWINRQSIQNKEIETLTEKINNSIVTIKESFRSNTIEIDSLSLPDFRLVRGFQNCALNLTSGWRDMNRNVMPSKSELKTIDLDKLRSIAEYLIKKGKEFDDEKSNVMAYIDTIKNYGIQNEIDDYLVSEYNMMCLRIGESQSSTLIYMEMDNNYNNSLKNYGKNKLVKFIKKTEKSKKNKKNLKYLDELFKTIIELDERYRNHINDEIKKRQI